MEKYELSDEKFEELTKGKKPFLTISYYEVEGEEKEGVVANIHADGNFLDPLEREILKPVVFQLGALVGKIRLDFLEEEKRKEEADSVKC